MLSGKKKRAHTHARMLTRAHMHARLHAHTHTHAHTYIFTHTSTHTHTHTMHTCGETHAGRHATVRHRKAQKIDTCTHNTHTQRTPVRNRTLVATPRCVIGMPSSAQMPENTHKSARAVVMQSCVCVCARVCLCVCVFVCVRVK